MAEKQTKQADQKTKQADPFDNISVGKRTKTGRRKSPIARITASDTDRAELQNFYRGIITSGMSISGNIAHWEDYCLMGAISVSSFILWLRGDRAVGHQEAYLTGVRVRKGADEEYTSKPASKPLHDFGPDAWANFKSLSRQEQFNVLNSAGALS